EAAEVGGGGSCMIKITKRLTLESSDGAAVTVLHVGGIPVPAVLIQANGGGFGGRGRGVTVTQGGLTGRVMGSTATNATLADNHVVHNGANLNDGLLILGRGHTISHNLALENTRAGFSIGGSGHTVSENVASGNFFGFDLTFSGAFTRNVATSNGTVGGI